MVQVTAMCRTCQGPIYQPNHATMREGAWLHLNPSDWVQTPHDAEPIDELR